MQKCQCWLKNVAWHESNHFGGKKIEKEVAWLGFELKTFMLEVESAYSRVRNKHSRMLINFLTFMQGLRP